MRFPQTRPLIVAAALVFLAGGHSAPLEAQAPDLPRTVQPGAPGESGRVLAPGEVRFAFPKHGEADVHFMQMMIAHHAQALEMSALAPERAARADVKLLAHRINTAQLDEIRLMARWLERRDEAIPEAAHRIESGSDDGAHHHHQHHTMPGMLTSQQMHELAASKGETFDRLFLEFMIFHHEGAILMVQELFDSAEGGQDGEIFRFASHVDSDQRIEIDRMRSMLTDGS